MSSENKFEDEVVDNKNKRMVRCQFCESLMLRQQTASFEKQEYDLPLMHQKNSRAPGEIEKETLSGFWVVEDMMTFENIGFSNTLDRTKFLICCDCEMGPVGYHNIDTRVSYVALSRVRHVD
ncbi:unnamed protein product [Hermetia illucens]|uniref:Guanine nucleotide exchange factor MSS4 homolog n=1 Tax=Hermetia illucens TaxID=343691 RepID=A0A7R8YP09_HERIL|nr:guanine nucleotide exchange factor MSS4 homolog [Hermetia illucens]CAD7079816.1 unnamed protein product [Hermetia illucens]